MLSKIEQQHYHRQLILTEIGEIGQSKLKKAAVLVIGAGGLGSAILPYLTAAGVGQIGIMDHDIVTLSNLHRQILFTTEDVGKNKATTAAEKLKRLNPHIRIIPYAEAIHKENAIQFISSYDIIVDGSDNFATKYLVNDAAIICNKPIVFGSIFKFEGQVSVFNYQNGPTYRCLFPEPPSPEESPNCSEIGVLGVLPGIIGSIQANEVLKIICGIGEVLNGKLLTLNCLTLQMDLFRFKKVNYRIPKSLNSRIYDCSSPNRNLEITFKQLVLLPSEYLLIDVRTVNERQRLSIKSFLEVSSELHIVLDELADNLSSIPKNRHIIFYRQSGIRSLRAAQLYKAKFPLEKTSSLKGGLDSIIT